MPLIAPDPFETPEQERSLGSRTVLILLLCEAFRMVVSKRLCAWASAKALVDSRAQDCTAHAVRPPTKVGGFHPISRGFEWRFESLARVAIACRLQHRFRMALLD